MPGSVSAIMKKSKNDRDFVNMYCIENFQIPDPPFPKVWVSGFPNVDRNGISVSDIMKKYKNNYHFVNMHHTEKFQIIHSLPQSFGLWFSKCQQKWNIDISHYEKIKKWPSFCKYASYRKNSNWVLVLTGVDRNRISALVIMKKLKNGHHFIYVSYGKIPNYHPP